jgi:sugar/nucleoside kinase (ribokinase family)
VRAERDIVGVGALNLDHAAAGIAVGERIARVLPALEWGTEHSVDEPTFRAAAAAAGTLTTTLGGSAFNTVETIARTRPGLRLGYVGIAGRLPPGAPPVLGRFDDLGIDRRFVFTDDRHLCGVCLSYTERGDRTLLTHAGANRHLAEHLDRHGAEVAGYLAGSRLVHVTSFLDPDTPGRLLAVLAEAKRLNPDLRISFDPGHVWASRPTPEIEGILAYADYLLVNEREFRDLGGRAGLVVVKRPDGVRVHRGDEVTVTTHVPLADDEIGDATGAGDAFAAGLLISLADGGFTGEPPVELGLRLARDRLRRTGT